MSGGEINNCPGCGTALVNSGPPIGEDYCPNESCTWDRDQFWAGFVERARAEKAKQKIRDAAPEMLSALKAVEADAVGVGSGENAISDKSRSMVEAAIAKAEGRS